MWQHPQLWYTSVTARLWGYTSYCGRSFLSGFPTQIPQTRWTLVSVRFLFLSLDFLRFSFFPEVLPVCVCPSMSCVTFVNLASIYSICFTLKLWANSSPCFKASPLNWKIGESCSFTFFNLTFNFSTIPLCSLMDKFSFLPSLGFSWYPGMETWLAVFEQPSADLER